MKNKDMLVAALNGAIDDGGDTLISYGHAHPLCADQDGTASRDRCAACIEKWLNAEVNT